MASDTITTAYDALKVGMRLVFSGRNELWEVTANPQPGTYNVKPVNMPKRKERRAAKREQPQHRYGPPRRSRY
jgi:hypothetical protein